MKVRLLLTLALLGAMTTMAEPPMSVIQVVVKDAEGKPVERASVILDFKTSHHQIFKLGKRKPEHWEVRTNMEGEAKFPAIPQGTVRIQVIAKDLQTFGKDFDVDAPQKTLDVTMKPPQKQYTFYGTKSDEGQPSKQQ